MLKGQQELQLSPYSELYNILVPSDHQLRLINELIDFTFVYQELKDKYSPSMGVLPRILSVCSGIFCLRLSILHQTAGL